MSTRRRSRSFRVCFKPSNCVVVCFDSASTSVSRSPSDSRSACLVESSPARAQQALERLAQTIDALAERRQVPLAGAQRLDPALGLAHRRLQHTHPLLIDLKALVLLPDPIERGAHLIHQRPPVLLESRGLAGHLVPHLGGALRPGGHVLDELFDARHHLLAAGGFLEPFVQLADLHVHRPDHLVEPVRLHRGPVDRVFLALQRFGLLRDMLGQRVERGELVLGRLTPILELHQRAEPALDVLHRGRRHGGILARRAGRVPQLRVVLAELSRGATHLLDLATKPPGRLDRLARLGLRLGDLFAQIFEHGPFVRQRLDARPRLQRLRGKVLHLLAVLLEVAVGRHQLLGNLLRRPGRLQHRLDALFHLVERLGPGLEAVDTRQHLTEPLADRIRLLVDRLKRLADLASFELRVETWVSMALSAPRSSRAVSISLWRSSTWRCAFPPPPIHLNTSIMWSLP